MSKKKPARTQTPKPVYKVSIDMTIIKKCINKNNKDFYNRDLNSTKPPALNLMPSEELSYRLDNVLPLTADHRLVIYNNMIRLECKTANPSNPGNCKNVTRKIKTFSENSRRNLSKHLCKIRFDYYKERWFVTLTFHNQIPNSQIALKKIIDKFNKRINRRNLFIDFVWKLEYQKRGAPHLHYLLLFPGRVSYNERTHLAGSIRNAWIECVGDNDELFKRLSVDIRQVGNNNKTVSYLMKYLDKLDDEEHEHNLGRFWAVSSGLVQDPLRIIKCDENFYQKIRDHLLYYIKSKYKISNDDYKRIALNNSFEVRLHFNDIKAIIDAEARALNYQYILAQLYNSPPT